MRTADFLLSVAEWLESPENEAMLLSEHDDECMTIVASHLVQAAAVIKKAAIEVDSIETTPEEVSTITPDAIEDLASFATELDMSDDPRLVKQAAVIDELLNIVISNPKKLIEQKIAATLRWKEIRDKSLAARAKVADDNSVHDTIRKMDRLDEAEEAIEKSKIFDTKETKEKRPLQVAMKTRCCPDPKHPGIPLIRISDDEWQCSLDNKVFDFANGFTLSDGTKIPGTSLDAQTEMQQPMRHQTTIFDDRESRLNR
jgi:hypothetical protein